jgi:hypothetical protein
MRFTSVLTKVSYCGFHSITVEKHLPLEHAFAVGYCRWDTFKYPAISIFLDAACHYYYDFHVDSYLGRLRAFRILISF